MTLYGWTILDQGHAPNVHHFKQMANIKPYMGSVKGGAAVRVEPKVIIVTSNYPPRGIWGNEEGITREDLQAIDNRVTLMHAVRHDLPGFAEFQQNFCDVFKKVFFDE